MMGGSGGWSAGILQVLPAILAEVRATHRRLDVVAMRLDTRSDRCAELIGQEPRHSR